MRQRIALGCAAYPACRSRWQGNRSQNTRGRGTGRQTSTPSAAGMFLVDASGRIVHANASGHSMVTERRLCALLAEVGCHRWARPIGSAGQLSPRREGDVVVGRKGIAVPLKARDGQSPGLRAHSRPKGEEHPFHRSLGDCRNFWAPRIYGAGPLLGVERQRFCDCQRGWRFVWPCTLQRPWLVGGAAFIAPGAGRMRLESNDDALATIVTSCQEPSLR